jgi:hypothetical protein
MENPCCRVTTNHGAKLGKVAICETHKREGWQEFNCQKCSGTGMVQTDITEYSRLHKKHIILVKKGDQCGFCVGTGKELDTIQTDSCGCQRRFINGRSLSFCKVHKIGPHACCEKAHVTNCVCAYSYTCPEHGDIHIGTHD